MTDPRLDGGRWLYGIRADRDGKTRTWTIETSLADAQFAMDEVPSDYENPRIQKRWEGAWVDVKEND